MQTEQAEHTLETIRTLMERSQRYEHISGYAGLVAGVATLAGCFTLYFQWLNLPSSAAFAVVWSSVFFVSFAAHCLLTFARAKQQDKPAWTRQARTVLLAILPCLIAGLAATIGLAAAHKLDWLPTAWLLFYGCGALATGCFAPRSITWLGGICLAIGILSLVTPLGPILTMAAGFGFTHLAFGVCVLIADQREAREQAFWREVDQLAQID